VLGKDAGHITKAERDSAKPVSFGRPGGMGEERLQQIARNNYGVDLTLDQVKQRIQAYHALCPELSAHLDDEVDPGQVLTDTLGLTVTDYRRARGQDWRGVTAAEEAQAAWLGGMLLKVLLDEVPVTQRGMGRPYTAEELDFFWERAQRLSLPLEPRLRARLAARQADPALWHAVRNWAGRRPVFTLTGRLRANATFCSSRNCIFQGPAADGAILALWRVWRAGYRLVDFVHDQLVVESPADDHVPERARDIERLMKEGMAEVIPGMRVKVETVVTRSLNKKDLDPRYHLEAKEAPRVSTNPAA
jgi:hypothetical protein